jgi:CubicO group peptidase (beta-lactamase class C family)
MQNSLAVYGGFSAPCWPATLWAGSGSLYWLDPVNGIAAAIYTQTLPFRDSAIMQAYAQFEHCFYQKLTV